MSAAGRKRDASSPRADKPHANGPVKAAAPASSSALEAVSRQSLDAGKRTEERRGRRLGESTTRAAIAREARQLFAAKGYDGASIRMIAAASGVDAALIAYFFGSKAELFAEVLELPLDPASVVPMVLGGSREQIGARLAGVVLGVLEDVDARNRVVALLRSASGNNEAAGVIRQRLTSEILEPIVCGLGVPDAELRAAMVMSQISGLTVARHVIGLDALADVETKRLARILAITLQHYLTEDLD